METSRAADQGSDGLGLIPAGIGRSNAYTHTYMRARARAHRQTHTQVTSAKFCADPSIAPAVIWSKSNAVEGILRGMKRCSARAVRCCCDGVVEVHVNHQDDARVGGKHRIGKGCSYLVIC